METNKQPVKLSLSENIWALVHGYYAALNIECTSIRHCLREIKDHIGNLRMAILDSQRCFQVIDNNKKNRRKLAPLRNALRTYALHVGECYETITNKLYQTIETGTALRVVERVQSTHRDIENDVDHPWITIINKITNTNAPNDIDTIDGLRGIFESLGEGMKRCSAPAAKSFSELETILQDQKELLQKSRSELEQTLAPFLDPSNPTLSEDTKPLLKSKLDDINGMVGGYFSMTEAIVNNLFRSYDTMTKEIDRFSKLIIEILDALKKKKISQQGISALPKISQTQAKISIAISETGVKETSGQNVSDSTPRCSNPAPRVSNSTPRK